MAAPTRTAYAESTYSGTSSAAETTGSFSWSAGDIIYVLGATDDNAETLNTPTDSSGTLTFAAISGFPTNTASTCKIYGWSATAPSNQSNRTVSSGTASGVAARGISAWVWSGSDGTGDTSVVANNGATTTLALQRTGDNSAVIGILSDWNAVNDVAVNPSPASGGTLDEATFVSGRCTFFVVDWTDQGAATTTSYGISDHAGAGKFAIGLVEVLGTADAGAPAPRLLSLTGAGT